MSTTAPARPPVVGRHPVTVRRHRVASPDGVRLTLDAYVPEPGHPGPVVVTRTPYSRAAHLDEGLGWSASGIAYVAQDVRGRYDSDGTWHPYEDERRDGAALLAWLHDQPWCDGRVVATGASYAAGTAWALAVEAQAAGEPLRGVVSMVPALGLGRVKFDPSGVLRLAEHVQWWVEHAESRVSRPGLARRLATARPDLLTRLPVTDVGQALWPGLRGWSDVALAGASGHVETAGPGELAALTVPSLHVGGWHDLLVGETLRQHATVGRATVERGARTLVVGPWGHDLGGPHATVGADGPLGRLVRRWVGAVLDPAAPARPTDSAHVADPLSGRWHAAPAWPPRATPGRRYLSAGGRLTDAVGPDGRDAFVHDAADAHPSRAQFRPHRHPVRADALRYLGDPLPDDLVLAGTPTARLRTGTDATADWVVRLGVVAPDASRTPLAQGVAADRPAGTVHVELSAVAVTVPAGHRLEVEVCGADFPALARHLGAGHDRYRSAGHARVAQHLTTGTSSVDLPVASGSAGEEGPR